MVLFVVHIVGVFIQKFKNQPPCSTYFYRPKPTQIVFKGMKRRAREIHVLDIFRRIEAVQQAQQFRRVFGIHTSGRPRGEELFKSLVEEVLDHENVLVDNNRNQFGYIVNSFFTDLTVFAPTCAAWRVS